MQARNAKTLRRWLSIGAVILSAAACSGGSDSVTAPGTTGTIAGRVTAGDGTTPVALASVYLESAGPGSGVTSDVGGKYTLQQVPSGSQVVIAVKGNFRSTVTVTVEPGKTTNAPAAKLAPQGKLGYVSGLYDNIQAIVTELGYPIESVSHASLESSSALVQYKMLFLNCGAGVTTDAATVNALKAWVQAGGTLYVSDWELDVVQAMFPNDILIVGSGDEQTITAAISDATLQQFTGKATASIAYDLPAWKMLQSVSNMPKVLLRGTVTGEDGADFQSKTFMNQVLAISITHGQGRIVYTTFHNEAGVTSDQLAVLRYFIHF